MTPAAAWVPVQQGSVLMREPTSRTWRLLVVDDDEGVRENLSELLHLAGYEVVSASNATEALEKLGSTDVDLLLTDFRMPGRSGLDLISVARNSDPDLRAILMTAYGDGFTEIESVRRGAIGYVTKPFEADEIIALVEKILALTGE